MAFSRPIVSPFNDTALVRSGADNAPASDAGVRFASRSRTAADSTTTTDVATRFVSRSRTAADATTTTDTATRFAFRSRTASDSAPASDGVTSSTLHFRTASDSVAGLADSATRLAIPYRRGPPDTAPATDSAVRTTLFRRNVWDLDLATAADKTAWQAGGTVVTPGTADPVGGNTAFTVDFTSGQVYAVTGHNYTLPRVEPLTQYLLEVDVISDDGTTFPIHWSLEDFSGTGTIGGGYDSVTIPTTWTTLSRVVTTGTSPDFYPLFYSFSGEAAGHRLRAYNFRLTKVVRDTAIRQPIFKRSAADTAPASDAVVRKVIARRITGRDGPDAVPGLAAWLDASQISGVTPGSAVTNVAANGAFGLDWTGANGGPIYRVGGVNGQPYLEHSAAASNGLVWAGNLYSGDSTVFVVARQRGTSNGRILSGINNNYLLGWWGGRSTVHYSDGWVYLDGPLTENPSSTALLAFGGLRSGGVNSFLRNGATIGSGGGTAGPWGLTTYGQYGEVSDADVYEVIAYDRALSQTEIDRVFGYLGTKYALPAANGLMVPQDVAPATDAVIAIKPSSIRSAADSTTTTDAVTHSRVLFRSASDSAPVSTDGAVRTVSAQRFATDVSQGDTTLVPTTLPGLIQANAPAAYWRLNTTTATVGPNLTAVGTIGSGPSLIGDTDGSAVFPGNARLDAGTNAAFNLTGLTYFAVLRMPDSWGAGVGSFRCVLSKQGVDRDFNLYLYSADGINATHFHVSSARFAGSFVAIDPLRPGSTHTLALTVSQTEMRHFIDGQMVSSGGTGAWNANNAYPLWLGQGDNYWSGGMDEVALFPTALSDATVAAFSDAALIRDFAVRLGTPFKRTPTDSAPAVDQDVRQASFYRTAADTVTPTDSATRTVIYRRAPGDTVSTTDAATRFASRSRSATDTTTTTDAANRIDISARSAADSITASDSATRSGIFKRAPVQDNFTPATPWTANYYAGADYTTFNFASPPAAALTQSEPSINSDWGTGNVAGSAVVGADSVVAVWTTTTFFGAGTYTFNTISDDGIRLYLDGVKVIDAWFPRGPNVIPDTYTATLSEGNHTVRVEWFEAGGGAVARVWWTGQDQVVTTDAPTRFASYLRTTSDSAPASDSASRFVFRARTATDTTTTTDVATRFSFRARTAADSAPATDGVTSPRFIVRTASDAAGPTDAATRANGVFSRTTSDAASPTESVARSIIYSRTAADLAAQEDTRVYGGLVQPPFHAVFATTGGGFIGDWATSHSVGSRTAADSVSTPTDTATRAITPARSAADSTTTSDSTTRLILFSRNGADSTSTSDAASQSTSHSRTASDSAPATDAATRFVSRSRTASDSTTTTDAATRFTALSRALADAAAAADAAVQNAPRFRTADDTVTPTDDVTRATIYLRTATDSTTTTEGVTRVASRSRTSNETGLPVASDAAARVLSVARIGIEDTTAPTVAPSGVVAPVLHPVAPKGGVATLPFDSASSAAQIGRTASDSAPVTDAATKGVLRPRATTDTAQVSDATARLATYRRIVLDQANYVLPATGGLVQPLVHPVQPFTEGDANDDVSRWVANYRRLADDATPASDSASRYVARSRTASDSAPASDVLTQLVTHFRTASDSAPASDQVLSGHTAFRSTSDTAPASDALTRSSGVFRRSLSDSAPADDYVGSIPPQHLSDSAPASDSVSSKQLLGRLGAESLTTDDSVSRAQSLFHRISNDTAPVTDAATKSVLRPRTAADSIGGSDAVARWVSNNRITRDAASFVPSSLGGLVAPPVHPVNPQNTGEMDDVARWVANYRRVGDDAITAADSATRYVFRARTATDSAPVVQTQTSLTTHSRTADDSAPAVDSLTSAGRLIKRIVAETVISTDAVLREVSYQRDLSDTAPADDHLSASPPQHLSDSAPADDSVARRQWLVRDTAEVPLSVPKRFPGLVQPIVHPVPADEPYMVVTDDAVRTQNLFRRVGDDAVLGNDGVASYVIHVREVSESVPATDSVVRQGTFGRLVRDEAGFVLPITGGLVQPPFHPVAPFADGEIDDAARWVAYYRRIGDEAVLGLDSVISWVLHGRIANDSAPVTEVLTHLAKHIRNLADDAPATDQHVRQTFFTRSAADTVTPTDSVQRGLALWRRTGSDTAPATDSVSAVPPGKTSDTAPVTDSASRLGVFKRTTAETVTGTDAAARTTLYKHTAADSVTTTDSVARAIVLKRSAADSTSTADAVLGKRSATRSATDQVTVTDVATRTSSYLRVLGEAAPTTETATRVGTFLRSSSEAVDASDTVSRRGFLFAFCTHFLPEATDSLTTRLLSSRTTEDTAPAVDVLIQTTSHTRNVDDSAPTFDVATRVAYEFRSNPRGPSYVSDYYDPPLDVATRLGAFFRTALDFATSNDQTPPPAPVHIRGLVEALPAVQDSLTAIVRAFRAAKDTAPVQDNLWTSRHLDLRRSTAETVSTADTAARSHTRKDAPADSAPVTDAVTRFFGGKRRGSDGASVTDSAARLLSSHRDTADSVSVTDGLQVGRKHLRALLDLLPAPVDVGTRFVTQSRAVRDLVLVPVDLCWWIQEHKVGFGPPVAEITSISKTKIGNEPGCDMVEITFVFDIPVDAWTVRINSTGPLDGTEAATWIAEQPGFGVQRFGTSPFGTVEHSVFGTEGAATIYAADLLHGANRIDVYGRASDGVWSFRAANDPVPDLVGAG